MIDNPAQIAHELLEQHGEDAEKILEQAQQELEAYREDGEFQQRLNQE